ncbi:MAG: SRPBCC domain-containing protein [bacterium]
MQDRQLVLNRVIEAVPEKVWRCWTDPQLLPRWFGPDGYSCVTREINLVQGGVWRFDMIGPDGTVYRNRHRIGLYAPFARIEFLMDADDDSQPPMEVEVLLVPEGAGTRLTQTITFPTAAARQGALGFGADRLGAQTMAKLAAMAEAL